MLARLLTAFGSARARLAAAAGVFLCLGVAAASHGAPDAAGLLHVRMGGDANSVRVVVELTQAAKGRLLADGQDRNVILALPGVPVAADLTGPGQGLVAGWSVDSVAGAARLNLRLRRPAQVTRRFLLPPADGVTVYRYVIDLSPIAPPVNAPVLAAAPRPVVAPQPLIAAASVVAAPPPHLKKVIVIDPGHGGHDPGALGSISREKDVNLAAARVLRAALLRTGRYKVVMTRESDVYVPLETRVQIARRADADLFISLHSDSGTTPDLRGATVYTLSDKGSDRVVRGVTDSNNWLIDADMPDGDHAVGQILRDLTQRTTRNRSAAFAEDVVDHIGDRVQARRSHRDAGFMVLLAPDVPAVLLEMGYITNVDDERLLNSGFSRELFMSEVAQSIDAYFSPNTTLASR